MQVLQSLFEKYDSFRHTSPALSKRRFKHKDILPLIQQLPYENMVIGKSFEEREIVKLKIGEGKTNILLWSQMHGNEATATMAMFDVFNFLKAKGDEFDAFRKDILANYSLHFIPMINPDGAERFVRRTAQGIDMNRDALALQCPESKILKNMVGVLKPEFSFNLHDKRTLYSAGKSGKQATVSFLATAYNEAKDWNEVRTKAMKVICGVIEFLQTKIPGHIGRWNDDFEPRAFGDNIQKWGSSLILIESGGYPDDTEKQFIRKLNFVAILGALHSISRKSYTKYKLADYEKTPQNDNYLFDLKIKNARTEVDGKIYETDLGINLNEKNNKAATDFTIDSVIADMGDLSTFWGIEEFDAAGAIIKPLSLYPELIEKHKVKKSLSASVGLDSSAYFVLEGNQTQTIVINGKIIK